MDHPVYVELLPQALTEVLLLFTGNVEHDGGAYSLQVTAFVLSLN